MIAAALEAGGTREKLRNAVTRGEITGGIDDAGHMWVDSASLREWIAQRDARRETAA